MRTVNGEAKAESHYMGERSLYETDPMKPKKDCELLF
jgi:hypothetical protein